MAEWSGASSTDSNAQRLAEEYVDHLVTMVVVFMSEKHGTGIIRGCVFVMYS